MLRLVLIASFLVAANGKVVPAWLAPGGGKIVGGEEVEIEDVPYQAGLLHDSTFICGGSILTHTVVITAAHCVIGIESNLQVFVGTNRLHIHGDKRVQVVDVSAVEIHPEYEVNIFNYDAALLLLSSPLKFGPTVKPVEIPYQNQKIADETPVVASGWGAIYENGPNSMILRKVAMPIVNQRVCNEAYETVNKFITSAMICAGLVGVGGKDSCRGDSGGPLVADGILVGIVSWGQGCAHPNFPGVYTRVSFISNWIIQLL